MTLQLRVDQLTAPGAALVRRRDLQVGAGVIHRVTGRGGSGKSSLLAAVCVTLPVGLHFEGAVSLVCLRSAERATNSGTGSDV